MWRTPDPAGTPLVCRQCGAPLDAEATDSRVICGHCGTISVLELHPIAHLADTLERKRQFQPWMDRLMMRYATEMGAGNQVAALTYYEAFQYLIGATAYQVEVLEDLEEWAELLLRDVAQQLGTPFVPARERGLRVSFAYVERLVEHGLDPP